MFAVTSTRDLSNGSRRENDQLCWFFRPMILIWPLSKITRSTKNVKTNLPKLPWKSCGQLCSCSRTCPFQVQKRSTFPFCRDTCSAPSKDYPKIRILVHACSVKHRPSLWKQKPPQSLPVTTKASRAFRSNAVTPIPLVKAIFWR